MCVGEGGGGVREARCLGVRAAEKSENTARDCEIDRRRFNLGDFVDH